LAQGRVAPLTGNIISAGDRIVLCKSCGSAFPTESWVSIGARHCGQSQTWAKILAVILTLHLKKQRQTEARASKRVFFFGLGALLGIFIRLNMTIAAAFF
jgi:hypothetical protein